MMNTTTIRISTRTKDIVSELAEDAGTSMQEILEQAVQEYRRQHFLRAANAAYGKLRESADAWDETQAELSVWDAALGDGLEDR